MKGLIFTYGLAYGGAFCALVNPYVGLLIYVTFAVLKPDKLWPWTVPEGNYSRVIGIAMLCGWMLKGFGTWRFGRAGAILVMFVVYWCCMIVSTTVAPEPGLAWPPVETMAKILVPFTVGLTVVDTPKKLKILIWVLVLSLGYIAYEQNLRYFQSGGINFLDTSNMLAHQMAAGCFVAAFTSLYSERLVVKVLAAFIAALMGHTVAIHMSRGAMVGLCAGGVATLYVLRKSPSKFALAAVGLAIAGVLAGPGTRTQFLTIFERADRSEFSEEKGTWKVDGIRVKPESMDERFRLVQAMSAAVGRNPMFGVGADNWPMIADDYGFPEGKQGHNLWLQTAVELGLLGVASYIGFFLIAQIRIRRALNSIKILDPVIRSALEMTFVATFVFVIEALFGSFHREVESFYYTVLIGAVGSDWLRRAAGQISGVGIT